MPYCPVLVLILHLSARWIPRSRRTWKRWTRRSEPCKEILQLPWGCATQSGPVDFICFILFYNVLYNLDGRTPGPSSAVFLGLKICKYLEQAFRTSFHIHLCLWTCQGVWVRMRVSIHIHRQQCRCMVSVSSGDVEVPPFRIYGATLWSTNSLRIETSPYFMGKSSVTIHNKL